MKYQPSDILRNQFFIFICLCYNKPSEVDNFMLARLHVILASEDEADYQKVRDELYNINSDFSISPSREYMGLKGHSEFYITCDLQKNQVQPLLDQLNNDWDGEIDDCICYGFNTKMFDSLVYYLGFTLFDE